MKSIALVVALACAATAVLAAPAPPLGAAPPANLDTVAQERLKQALSAEADIRMVRAPRWVTVDTGAEKLTGWAVCYFASGRNSYGAYDDGRTALFVFDDGGVKQMIRTDTAEPAAIKAALAECSTPSPAAP